MKILCKSLLTLALLLLGLSAAKSEQASPTPDTPSPEPGTAVAVADFSGPDRELGRFLSDTLLTDLAQSDRLRMSERAEIKQALTELKLQESGLTVPQQARRVGKLVGADRLIVGSFLPRDGRIVINARLLDVRTGRVMAGSAATVSGSLSDTLPLVHRLARTLHHRITGEDLSLGNESDGGGTRSAQNEEGGDVWRQNNGSDMADNVQPVRAREQSGRSTTLGRTDDANSNRPVTERELAVRMRQIAPSIRLQTVRPNAAVTRLRVLVALVKALMPPDSISSVEPEDAESAPRDMAQIPLWARSYVMMAVRSGWWPSGRKLQPAQFATHTFLNALLAQANVSDQVSAPPTRRFALPSPRPSEDTDGFTGLIVDARDVSLERAMSLRILDEDGAVLYPDPKYLPDYDYLVDNGLASYIHSREDAVRSGSRPLKVRAVGVAAAGHEDIVVSREAASRIQRENERSHFLRRWRVSVLVDAK